MTIAHYQLATALVWGAVTLGLLPSALRAFSKRRSQVDEWKAALFYVGLLLVAFPSRWLMLPGDELTWKILYALGIVAGAYAGSLLWNGRKR